MKAFLARSGPFNSERRCLSVPGREAGRRWRSVWPREDRLPRAQGPGGTRVRMPEPRRGTHVPQISEWGVRRRRTSSSPQCL